KSELGCVADVQCVSLMADAVEHMNAPPSTASSLPRLGMPKGRARHARLGAAGKFDEDIDDNKVTMEDC
ncbi:hypothetical protein LTR66_008073, partial [Elasticomyces elasticus]